MNERDRKALEQIGTIDLDNLPIDKETEREDDIKSAMEFLEEIADDDLLSTWEYDFYESLTGFIARGYRLTDKQFEKLLQIKVKYE